jgi:hypothetical protein
MVLLPYTLPIHLPLCKQVAAENPMEVQLQCGCKSVFFYLVKNCQI